MIIDDDIYMIQNRDDEVSAYYSDQVIPSWDKFGYYVNMFDCVYPDTLHEYDYLEFGQYWGLRDMSEGEKLVGIVILYYGLNVQWKTKILQLLNTMLNVLHL